MMAAKGLAKLIEECGELLQVAGKRLAYYHTAVHPDGGPLLTQRLEEEIADVMAACEFVIQANGLDGTAIALRIAAKLIRFRAWHADARDNAVAVDYRGPDPA